MKGKNKVFHLTELFTYWEHNIAPHTLKNISGSISPDVGHHKVRLVQDHNLVFFYSSVKKILVSPSVDIPSYDSCLKQLEAV